MNALRPALGGAYAFGRAVGTGGIGTGMLLQLDGDHTLGRNESRSARLVPAKDYCKLHIIFHYLAVLLGSGQRDGFPVHPVGAVGSDPAGRALLDEMAAAGMRMRHVAVAEGSATLFSVCFQYPDSTGGNITAANNASAAVAPEHVAACFAEAGAEPGRGLALAVPEVPLETRLALLLEAKRRDWFTVASLLSSEAAAFESAGGYTLADVLAVNVDEAAAIVGTAAGADATGRTVAERCADKLQRLQPDMRLIVTDGPHGSYSYADGRLTFTPPLPADAVGTGGAGDAFLAGTLAGLICGLPLRKNAEDRQFGDTPLAGAVELGTLLASLSVTSPNTIHERADADLLYRWASGNRLRLSPEFAAIFAACDPAPHAGRTGGE